MDPSTLTFGLSLGPRPLTPEPETLHAGPELSIGSNRDADKKKGGARGDWCCFKSRTAGQVSVKPRADRWWRPG
eukprot:919412-Rhodomonas_salina.2